MAKLLVLLEMVFSHNEDIKITPYLSKSPLQSALTGMVNGCHTGLSVFFTTSVLWQIVNLHVERTNKNTKTSRHCKTSEETGIRLSSATCSVYLMVIKADKPYGLQSVSKSTDITLVFRLCKSQISLYV